MVVWGPLFDTQVYHTAIFIMLDLFGGGGESPAKALQLHPWLVQAATKVVQRVSRRDWPHAKRVRQEPRRLDSARGCKEGVSGSKVEVDLIMGGGSQN